MHDVPGVHADSERNLRLPAHLRLNLDGALDGLDGAMKHTEGAVAVVLEDLPVVTRDDLGEGFPLALALGVCPFLILLHESGIAHHVREHDGRKVSGPFFHEVPP